MITRENTLRGRTVVTTEDSGGEAPPVQTVSHVVEIVRPDGTLFKELPGGPFAWGAPTRQRGLDAIRVDNEGRINLSKALLGWVIGNPNDPRVTQYYQRFKLRVAQTLGNDWTMRAADIKGVVEDIISVEQETAQSRAMVAMTPAPIVSERGADIVWDTDDRGARITRPGE